MIGQRYEVLTPFTQTPYWQSITALPPTLQIEVKIESPPSGAWSETLNQRTILLLQCLTLLNILFVNAPEGLKEASEALESMVEYYRECSSDLQQTSLPQDLGVITGSVLQKAEVRPPLVLDFE